MLNRHEEALNLERLFNPSAIAICGASQNLERIGGRPIKFSLEAGFKGKIYPVNPKYEQLGGLRCYKDIREIDGDVDVAIIALPASAVKEELQKCGEKGVPFAIIFSAGFAELGEEGKKLQQEIVATAKNHRIRILGPNCLGILNPYNGFMATFSTFIDHGAFPKAGKVGLASQSGALASYCMTLVRDRGIGISCWVTTGNESDLDIADCISYLAEDANTEVILGTLE